MSRYIYEYLNISNRTITIAGRRVKSGHIVDVGTARKSLDAAVASPDLQRAVQKYDARWWTESERTFVFKMNEWWLRHPWVSQYRIVKTLQRSAELSHRTYASIRGKVYLLAREFGVAYTFAERRERWTTKNTVEDGRLRRGKHLINGGKITNNTPA